jgi:hydrogenase maturation protease
MNATADAVESKDAFPGPMNLCLGTQPSGCSPTPLPRAGSLKAAFRSRLKGWGEGEGRPHQSTASALSATGAPEKTLLLGLGNDILSDDAIGLSVAAEVRRRLQDRPDITVVETGERGLSLLDFVADCHTLVVVDAVQTGSAPPGFVHELNGYDLAAVPTVAPHCVGLGEVLALGRLLGVSVPRSVKLIAIEVADALTMSTEMTPALRAALPAIVERVLQALNSSAARHRLWPGHRVA